MLLEEHALVRHVLVDDPQSLRVYGDDVARVHLAERLELAQLIAVRRAGWRLERFAANGVVEILGDAGAGAVRFGVPLWKCEARGLGTRRRRAGQRKFFAAMRAGAFGDGAGPGVGNE